jgi:hypothetical protein
MDLNDTALVHLKQISRGLRGQNQVNHICEAANWRKHEIQKRDVEMKKKREA